MSLGTRDTGISHATIEAGSRQAKAKKIERLLELDSRPGPLRLLEVGTGSGGIANYFGTHASGRFVVDAVDVIDGRRVSAGFRFALTEGASLPFDDAQFDVVISNHVIEHVGDAVAQARHLDELRRVLHPDGVGYLAVPNRWMLVEPHFRVFFLSWWPRSWRTPYLRLLRGDARAIYDCEPLRLPELVRLLAASGFKSSNECIDAMRLTFEIERPRATATRILRHTPDALMQPFLRLIPTLIFRLWK